MKKIIFVNNNMNIGGVQKALLNLLCEIKKDYDVTLLLFCPTGDYMKDLPSDINVLSCSSLFQCLGISQNESRVSKFLFLKRGILAFLTKTMGRQWAMKLILASQKPIPGSYDCAVSFLHNGGPHSFYGGCNEFVLQKINSAKKVAFLHCDYGNCGANDSYNNSLYRKFDRIAACSAGCRNSFLQCMPDLKEQTVVVTNCQNFHQIWDLSMENTVTYPAGSVHVISVARLSYEKGIDRGIRAVAFAAEKGLSVQYHIVGNGPKRAEWEELASDLGIQDSVFFMGDTGNPYRCMKNADLLLIPSRHEAAPLVIDEAMCLGLPILSAETTSSSDMIEDRSLGWICSNEQSALDSALAELLAAPDLLAAQKQYISLLNCSNNLAIRQFNSLIHF